MNLNEMFGMNLFNFFFLIILAVASILLSLLAKNKARKGVGLIATAVVIQVFFHGSTINLSINGFQRINLDSVIFFIGIFIQIIGVAMVLLYGGLLENKKRSVARQKYEAAKRPTASTVTVKEDVPFELGKDDIQVPSFMNRPASVRKNNVTEKIFGSKNKKMNPEEC